MKKVKLTKNKFAIVDDDDFDFISKFSWFYHNCGYAFTNLKETRKQVGMHRVLMGLPSVKKVDIDHINGNKLDNTRANLRICTRSENLMNREKTIASTSGYKGVTWDRQKGKWKAQIMKDGINIHLGHFDDASVAHSYYVKAAIIIHGDFSFYKEGKK